MCVAYAVVVVVFQSERDSKREMSYDMCLKSDVVIKRTFINVSSDVSNKV